MSDDASPCWAKAVNRPQPVIARRMTGGLCWHRTPIGCAPRVGADPQTGNVAMHGTPGRMWGVLLERRTVEGEDADMRACASQGWTRNGPAEWVKACLAALHRCCSGSSACRHGWDHAGRTAEVTKAVLPLIAMSVPQCTPLEVGVTRGFVTEAGRPVGSMAAAFAFVHAPPIPPARGVELALPGARDGSGDVVQAAGLGAPGWSG